MTHPDPTPYRVEVRRYTGDADDVSVFDCPTAAAAAAVIDRQAQHGPFRAWVNGAEVRAAAPRPLTNPATYADLGCPL